MSSKRWRLVVTELGGSTPVAEAVVDAPNWMAAFKSARGRIGEPEAIPIGGSCTVSPDGRVNVLDPQRRRAYALLPMGDTPSEVAPQPTAQPAAAAPPPSETARRPRPKTMAYIPDAMVPPVAAPAAPPSVAKKTMAYMPGQLGLPPIPPREIAVGQSPSPVVAESRAPQAHAPAPSTPATVPMTVRVAGERSVPASAESPVHYHEVALDLTGSPSPQHLEGVVREHLGRVRSQVGGDAAVQLVRVLAFASPRESAAEPLAVGVWKGWTDEIAVQFPSAERSIELSLEAPADLAYAAAADDPRLSEIVEAFEDVWFLASPAAGLEFTARVLEEHFADALVVTAVRESATSPDFHVASTRGGWSVADVPDRLVNDGLVAVAAADPARPVAVLDASRDPRTRPASDGSGAGPFVASASSHGGAVLGLVRLSRPIGMPHFSASDVDLVRCASDRLATFLRSRGTHLD